MKIIPAIIPETKEHLLSSLEAIRSVSHEVQIDFVDGVYAGVPSWPFAHNTPYEECAETLREVARSFSLECDLMIREPLTSFDLYASIAERVVLHWGSTAHIEDFLSKRTDTLKVGIALTNEIPLVDIFPYVDRIDFIQCMGIAEVGAQGHGFDPRVLPRIREIHEAYPTLEISVDGHVTMFTLPLLKDAGATRFMAGSSIFNTPNPAQAFLELQALADA